MIRFKALAVPALILLGLGGRTAEAQVKVVIDTTYGEGAAFKVAATPNANVTYYWWSVMEGYKYKILDPESKVLSGILPRVAKDEFIRFRFSAKVKDAVESQDVKIRIRNDVPDPQFQIAPPASWDGAKSVVIKPGISNLQQIKSCRFPTLRYSWYADSVPVDTAWRDSSMVLKSASANGTLALKLCLDNGGSATCKSAVVLVKRPSVALINPGRAPGRTLPGVQFWRPDGRQSVPGAGPSAAFPRIRATP